MELSTLQRKIVEAKEQNIVVIAAAAAGKTATLTERVRWLVSNGADPSKIVVFTFTNAAADEMRKRLGEEYRDVFINTVHSYAYSLLLKGGLDVQRLADEERFDEFFELISENLQCIEEVDYLLLDEAQDSNSLQFDFIFDMIKPKNTFLVGDCKQCQPAGTKVLMFDKTYKNIEDLKVGDKIITYDLANGRVSGGTAYNSINKKITQIAKRKLSPNEKLIKITTSSGKISRYTKNHICITNLCKKTEYNYLVYLMCDKNNRFRVGTSQLQNTTSNPWRKKMNDENCEKIWILDTFKTNKEARVLEDKISYFYQIPQITYQTDKTSYTIDDINFIYDGLDTYTSAIKCLQDFNRDISFPFAQKDDNIHYASNAFNKCYACNILPNNMIVKVFDENNKHRQSNEGILKLEYETNNEFVYSLDVEDFHTYIADDIVTHNCIYQFAGSRPDILHDLSFNPNFTSYSLNENYRNGPTILNFAKKIISGSQMKDGTPLYDDSVCMREFEVDFVSETEFSPELLYKLIEKSGDQYKDWFLLGRTNDQVDYMMELLKKRNIPCDTFKRSQLSLDDFRQKMEDNTVKVLTVHASKGLEAKNVLVMGVAKWTRSLEERCIAYVAATRAKTRLIWTKAKAKKARRITNWE